MKDAKATKKPEQKWEKVPAHHHSLVSVGIWLTNLMIGKFRNNKSTNSEDHILNYTRTFPNSKKLINKKGIQPNGSKSTNLETELPDSFEKANTSSTSTVLQINDEMFVSLISKNIDEGVQYEIKKEKGFYGPLMTPKLSYQRLYDPMGPVHFCIPPTGRAQNDRAEVRPWSNNNNVISQNLSKRKVHRAYWLSSFTPDVSYPAAIKFVEDKNAKDGRSIKREIECHLYIYKNLKKISLSDGYEKLQDAWPCSELLGYHLDPKNPGNCVLITRKLSGPDFFDIIRKENSGCFNGRTCKLYEYHKLRWCVLALQRVSQLTRLGIRHNDIKPDNIVLDIYEVPNSSSKHFDVKIIDLGTASLENTKEFTGGTSWYESPEQKMLEFYTKKTRNLEEAQKLEIGAKSDAWGTGLSISEILMGKRIVDSLNYPGGPGPLEFNGKEAGWKLDPAAWRKYAQTALCLDYNVKYSNLCYKAALHVFDKLVKVVPQERSNVWEVIPFIINLLEEARTKVLNRDH